MSNVKNVKNKKIGLLLILIITFFISVPKLSLAQQLPNLDTIKNQISGPISSFINSIQRAGLDSLSPKVIFNKIDAWFYDTTGTQLVSILKPVGKMLVWIFSTLADLIRWGLSLI